MSLPSIKHYDAQRELWIGIIYWHGGNALHVIDITGAKTETEIDDWTARLVDAIPLGNPATGKVGAKSLAIFEIPRKRSRNLMKSVPSNPMDWYGMKKPKGWV